MRRRLLGYGLTVALVVAVGVYLGLVTGAFVPLLGGYDPASPGDYEETTVTVRDGETGEELGTVEAAIADTARKRYVGLSGTESLPEDYGMVFVHAETAERTYVMRDMAFGIDIVYVAANGTITRIHHAPAPGPNEDGGKQRYPGTGRYVLEVNYGWTTDHGIETGDRIEFEE